MNDAIILVNKPRGLSSNRVLQQVKHLLGFKKAGHTGSLDPLATGMLPICLGRATKVCEYLLAGNKAYHAQFKLGQTTNTLDQEGEVLVECDVPNFNTTTIEAALAAFKGEIEQVPPMYSALKHQGQPLYKLARAGISVARHARKVTIYRLELIKVALPYIEINVVCSKGTYIRTLAEDIGQILGVGAHLTSLHRQYCAGFEHQPMFSLDQIQEQQKANKADTLMLSVDEAFHSLPRLDLTDQQWQTVYFGQVIDFSSYNDGLYRFYCTEQFLGLFEINQGRITARKQMADYVPLGKLQ